MFCRCQRRFFFFPQPAVPERWILLSAVKTPDPESSQSSLCLATDDLYLIPVFLCICTALVSSLLLCHPLCLPVSAYLPFICGFLSSFTSPPPSHPIPPRHSRNLSAHPLVIPSLFCRETNLPLPLSSDPFKPIHLILLCCFYYLRHRSHHAAPERPSSHHFSLHCLCPKKSPGRLQAVKGHLLANLTGP